MRKRLDLTGRRFGKLTVLRPAENIEGCTAWVCRCDCGQETIVKTSTLRNDRAKSCGCRRRTQITEMEKARKNNTSSVTGVEWLPDRKRWKASICLNRKRYYLGEHLHFEDAAEARRNAEKARKQVEENARNRFLREFASAQVQNVSSIQEQNAG